MHYRAAAGVPAVSYRVDTRPGRRCQPAAGSTPASCPSAGTAVLVRGSERAGSSTIRYGWRVVPMPKPVACQPRPGGKCWYPPHLTKRGKPMRWDWQIGRVTPLQRTGSRAVDIYDIDGFLTTAAQVHTIHTRWQAATLPHPKLVCYLDLAWEDYRPDASPGPVFSATTAFPAATLGNVYFGYPQERWVDFRQLDALKPMLDERIAMCARKGFDAVELDDIDSFDPPSETGFDLTPGDAQNFLAYALNQVHRDGMTALWKNSPYLTWWARGYADGAVVEECYVYHQCLASAAARQPAVRHHLHGADWRDAVRLGRVQHRPHEGAADRQVGRRGGVLRRPLRLQPGQQSRARSRAGSARSASGCTRRPTASPRSSSTWTWTAGCSCPARAECDR